jgi:hypothetical protein
MHNANAPDTAASRKAAADLGEIFKHRRAVMTPTPTFDDLTPPDKLIEWWSPPGQRAITLAYQAGARHGWEQARPLWPEPITDRPPTEADGDGQGWVMIVNDGVWRPWHWADVGDQGWLHTPRWQPRQPSLQDQAIEALDRACTASDEDRALIRRALEQAGEGQA